MEAERSWAVRWRLREVGKWCGRKELEKLMEAE